MDDEIRQLILKNVSSDVLREAAKRTGLRSLAEDGWRLVRTGITTPEEVLRVTKDQSLSDNASGTPAEKAGNGKTSTEKTDALVSV